MNNFFDEGYLYGIIGRSLKFNSYPFKFIILLILFSLWGKIFLLLLEEIKIIIPHIRIARIPSDIRLAQAAPSQPFVGINIKHNVAFKIDTDTWAALLFPCSPAPVRASAPREWMDLKIIIGLIVRIIFSASL